MNKSLRYSLLSISAAFMLISCGSGGGVSAVSSSSSTISGKAVDGYLQKATVCLDLDLDGFCSIGVEPATSTGDDGSYTLTLSAAHKNHINFKKAPILVYDGKDSDTGERFSGRLQAPNDGNEIFVSPTTTLVHKALEEELKGQTFTDEEYKQKLEEKKEVVRKAMKIPDNVDVMADPVALQLAGDSSLLDASVSLHKSAKSIKSDSSEGSKSKDDLVEDMYKVFAQGLNALTPAELDNHVGNASTSKIDAILNKAKDLAEADETSEIAQLFPPKERKAISAVNAMVKNISKLFQNSDSSDESAKKIAAIIEQDTKKIEDQFKALGEDEDFALDLIEIFDDNAEELKANYRWEVDAINDFLTNELLLSLSEITGFANIIDGANIKPWEIESKLDEIKDLNNTIHSAIRNAIDKIESKIEEEIREDEIKRATSFQKINLPLSIFELDVERRNNQTEISYKQITLQESQSLKFESFMFNSGTWTPEVSNNYFYILDTNNTWDKRNDNGASFSVNLNDEIVVDSLNIKVALNSIETFENEKFFLPELEIDVTTSTGAAFNKMKMTQLRDTYEVRDEDYYLKENNISTISELITFACGKSHGVLSNDENNDFGISFTTIDKNSTTCSTSATSGTLSEVDFRSNKIKTRDAGSWEIITKGDNKLLVLKPKRAEYVHDRRDGTYPLIAELKDDSSVVSLYRGEFIKEGAINTWVSFNSVFMEDIKLAIQNGIKEEDSSSDDSSSDDGTTNDSSNDDNTDSGTTTD